VLKPGGKIVVALVHVNSDSYHSQMRRLVLRAHLHKHAGYFVPIKLNIVGQLDRGLEAELGANHVRDGFDRPDCEPSRVAELDLGS
jgi:hypothetical protein